jgi:sulfite reductase alpha subunit-like flavoprotein
VQGRILYNKDRFGDFWWSGAQIYVCGSKEVAKEIGVAARVTFKERMKALGTP